MNKPAAILEKTGKLKLTVDEFLLLDNSGAFESYAKAELLDGEIWIMNAQLTRHARIKTDLAIELALVLRGMTTDLRPIVEASTRISQYSLPEPDIAITNYAGDDYLPLDSLSLVIEIADSSLRIDLGRKLRTYAEARVPEYWVVDIRNHKLHQMWSPVGKAYLEKRELALGEIVMSETIAGLRVTVPRT
ncbi:MAG: Uma2 family endonuclease [Novosphingobium sp.]